jgi:hypothetical protein
MYTQRESWTEVHTIIMSSGKMVSQITIRLLRIVPSSEGFTSTRRLESPGRRRANATMNQALIQSLARNHLDTETKTWVAHVQSSRVHDESLYCILSNRQYRPAARFKGRLWGSASNLDRAPGAIWTEGSQQKDCSSSGGCGTPPSCHRVSRCAQRVTERVKAVPPMTIPEIAMTHYGLLSAAVNIDPSGRISGAIVGYASDLDTRPGTICSRATPLIPRCWMGITGRAWVMVLAQGRREFWMFISRHIPHLRDYKTRLYLVKYRVPVYSRLLLSLLSILRLQLWGPGLPMLMPAQSIAICIRSEMITTIFHCNTEQQIERQFQRKKGLSFRNCSHTRSLLLRIGLGHVGVMESHSLARPETRSGGKTKQATGSAEDCIK